MPITRRLTSRSLRNIAISFVSVVKGALLAFICGRRYQLEVEGIQISPLTTHGRPGNAEAVTFEPPDTDEKPSS
jgi:hypothetical protein